MFSIMWASSRTTKSPGKTNPASSESSAWAIRPKNRVWFSTTTLASSTLLRATWYGQEGPQWRMLHACGSLHTMAHTLGDGRNAMSLRVPSCVLSAQS